MKEIRVSPSQIGTFHNLCARRWWYKRNRPPPPRPANDPAEYGTRVHALLELWQATGAPMDLKTPEGRTAVAGLGFLPPPKIAEVEIPFSFLHDGVRYNGRVDFAHDYVARERVTIGDHKTIGDLKRRKTEDDLVWDPQRIIYSHWAAQRYKVQHVRASWVYYQRVTKSRKSGKSEKVEIAESADMIAERFEDLHQRKTLPIVNARRDDRGPTALPRNFEACHLFPPHGCPYREECHGGLDPVDRLASAFGA